MGQKTHFRENSSGPMEKCGAWEPGVEAAGSTTAEGGEGSVARNWEDGLVSFTFNLLLIVQKQFVQHLGFNWQVGLFKLTDEVDLIIDNLKGWFAFKKWPKLSCEMMCGYISYPVAYNTQLSHEVSRWHCHPFQHVCLLLSLFLSTPFSLFSRSSFVFLSTFPSIYPLSASPDYACCRGSSCGPLHVSSEASSFHISLKHKASLSFTERAPVQTTFFLWGVSTARGFSFTSNVLNVILFR